MATPNYTIPRLSRRAFAETCCGAVQWRVKQARQSLAGAAMRWREEGPDSIERGDG